MYNFKNDYSEGAHPQILQRLCDTNFQQQQGYGEDEFSKAAKELIKKKTKNTDAVIYFVSGGTQANLVVIAALLKMHEAVISAKTGHIYAHETGAIEATGHRIISVDTKDGKICTADVEQVMGDYSLRPHVVKPKMVYISNSTEMGTIYNQRDLELLADCCRTHKLLLFLDGARLGHALTAENNDMDLADIAKHTDVFYIGGTKNGAMLGEAIVFNNPKLAPEFDYVLKQKGALLAKGRLLGIQFLELFKDNLYFDLAHHANNMASKIAAAITANGYTFMTKPFTNKLFPILPKKIIDTLSKKYLFYEWATVSDDKTAVRIITSWATDEGKVDELINDLDLASR